MPRDNLLYLAEIVEAIDQISRWLGGIDEDGWASHDILRATVLQQLTVIGEASRGVSNELRERNPNVPRQRIADFRNVAVYQYFAIEWSIVWRLARDRVPILRPQILKVIEVEFPDIGSRFEEQ